MPDEPEWLKKARAEGRITEGRPVSVTLGQAEVVPPPEEKAKRSKFGNVASVIDGLRFDSKKEARRWVELLTLQKAGTIRNLRHHVRFDLVVNGVKISHYTADAVYEEYVKEKDNWREIVEDTKSESSYVNRRDRSYGIRKKLMKALYNINIREV